QLGHNPVPHTVQSQAQKDLKNVAIHKLVSLADGVAPDQAGYTLQYLQSELIGLAAFIVAYEEGLVPAY
ncbi:hypothetical protein DPMN_093614, partial [Dreissena polymorpha]